MKKYIGPAILVAATLLGACTPFRGSPPDANAAPVPQAASERKSTSSTNAEDLGRYDRIITEDVETATGLLTTHRDGEKLYFEIPDDLFGKELFLVGRLVKGAPQVSSYEGYGGDKFTEQAVRWDRVGDRVLLRRLSYQITADADDPIAEAVELSNHPGIIASFEVEAYGEDSAAVIDVTRLFTTAVPHVQALTGTVDERRSFVEGARAFPDNVVIEATQTQPVKVNERAAALGIAQVRSVTAHWSLIRLPEDPMPARLADPRVGYFDVFHYDFSSPENRALRRQFIARYRLEKKDPAAALSEPVEPIVYYIDPATPEEMVPYVKAGIEAWQPAFEEAGFKDAIIAKDAPTPEEDPDWSPEDVRNTVVRWLASTVENAQGPRVVDPRTGEILNGSVRMFHNIMVVLRDMYFAQVAPLDLRTQELPFPDSVMGPLVQYVVSHEIGHTLGLQHNFKAASTFPADSLRSESWLRTMGYTPSVMSYTRFNYVVQPEDGIDPSLLIPRVGPYDRFAIRWGYTPIPGAETPDDELEVLDEWAREQETVPWYRFATSGAKGADVGEQTEVVGASDPIYSTRLGLRNIERTIPLILSAVERSEAPTIELSRIYQRTLRQWSMELGHVAAMVGGVESQEKVGTQPGIRFVPVPGSRQREAVEFLHEHAFQTPHFLLDKDILRRLEPQGALGRIRLRQSEIVTSLLDNATMLRLLDFEALAEPGSDIYTLPEMIYDLRAGIFSELSESQVQIDPFRRNLHFIYLAEVEKKLDPSASTRSPTPGVPSVAVPDGARAVLRTDLVELQETAERARTRTSDRGTRAHLNEIIRRIEGIVELGL